MTYQEAISFLYAQLPMFSRVGAAAYRKDLVNIRKLCDELDQPQNGLKFIHVAGTNGKGSTCHFLSSILQEAGYLTGLYTSPHLYSFTERIRINGDEADEDFVVQFTERIKPAIEKVQPSFFELTFAMALEYFAQKRVHIAVIETGMGGRLDSTNIIQPLVSVITNIGLEHTAFLGDDLATIAGEKAGIIKNDSPVVLGEALPETLPVIVNKANEMNAPLMVVPSRFLVEYLSHEGGFLQCHIKDLHTGTTEKLQLDATGLYQGKNACTTLGAITALRQLGWDIPEEAVHNGFRNTVRNTHLKGRWEIIAHQPTVILDVAHNADGFREVIFQLRHQYPERNYHFIVGMVSDKDHAASLALLPESAQYYFTQSSIPRAMTATDLQQAAHQFNLSGNTFTDINEALAAARNNAGEEDIIICLGSFFTLSELKQTG